MLIAILMKDVLLNGMRRD